MSTTQARLDALYAALLKVRDSGEAVRPPQPHEVGIHTLPNGAQWQASQETRRIVWAAWCILAERAALLRQGLKVTAHADGSVTFADVNSARGQGLTVAVSASGRVGWNDEQNAWVDR